MLVSIFTIAIIGFSLFGYARLASFIVDRSLLSAILIGGFSILRNFVYDATQHILLMGLWVKTFRMRKVFIRKFDFWFGIIAEPLMLLVLIGAVLVLWGVPFDVLKSNVYKAISGFTVGGIKISLLSIMWGAIVFALCLWIIKMVRYRIEFKMLEKTNLDSGTKHSLASGFAYICYVLAGLLAIAIMGGNLTNIALIAGALSVGIGLGLQDIVNNFVSGIIMLFERPLKVGDWVVIGNEEGEVKQINIRSTEVQTFNRASVIIPNSQVLSNSVVNRTHENNWARYGVKVGVAYGSDVEQVRDLLLECVLSHPKVSKKPAPYVLFQDFGESSLDFEVRFYVSDINVGWTAPSDVRFIINKRFKEEGIEIPFKQMVIHQGSQIADRTENQFYAKKKGAKKNAD
jgi:small-conductance mechanosensitive channel